MGTNTGHVMTLANSIIGVSVLAMPFCFKQCGILLAALVLLLSNIMSRLACHYILKSAILSRRRTFEFLAFHVFGPTGKLTVELSIIGFMLGTCVAYFVVVGDLGPAIIGPAFNLEHPATIRPTVLIALALFVVLPLGLLRNVDSLSAICAITIAFYLCLVLKVMGEATNHLIAGDWLEKVNLWRPVGILQCLPIFSMALSCQTQLFEIFESLPNASLDKMNSVVRSAINMCTAVYMAMGVFGYIAYCTQPFTGNVMMSFSPTMTSEVIKLGFVLAVAVSFPLVIFPCRASLHSLLFRRGHTPHHELMGTTNYIPEQRFQCITILIITVSLITGLLIPNIELVLGLVGSTIGVLICIMVPAVLFLCLTSKHNNERLLAQVLFFVGLLIMVLGTYANLFATEEAMSGSVPGPAKLGPVLAEIPPIVNLDQLPVHQDKLEPKAAVKIKDETLKNLKDVKELAALPELKKDNTPLPPVLVQVNKIDENKNEVRQEPPIPVAPAVDIVSERAPPPPPPSPIANVVPIVPNEEKKTPPEQVNIDTNIKTVVVEKKEETIAKEAIKKEEDEIKEVDTQNKEAVKKEEDLINQVVKQDIKKETKKELLEKYVKIEEVKQKINEEQKKILEEIKEENKKEKLAEDIKNINEEIKPKVVKDNKIENEVIEDTRIEKVDVPKIEKSIEVVNNQNTLEVKEKDNSIMNKKMMKGIPLPIAVQDNLKDKNTINELKPVDLVNELKIDGVDDKVLRREILENKVQDEKEDRAKRDTEMVDENVKITSEGKYMDIEGGGDGMKEKVDEENGNKQSDLKKTDILNDVGELKDNIQELKQSDIVESKNDNIPNKNNLNMANPDKTFAQILKDTKIEENEKEQCEDKKLNDVNELKPKVPNVVKEKEVEMQKNPSDDKSTIEKLPVIGVEEIATKESLIKMPQFLSNPAPILLDQNLQPDVANNVLINDAVKPMKRDLKSVNPEKREAKDRET